MKSDTPVGRAPSIERRRNDVIAFWEHGQLAFALIGALQSPRLLQLAAMLAPANVKRAAAPGRRPT